MGSFPEFTAVVIIFTRSTQDFRVDGGGETFSSVGITMVKVHIFL